MMQGRSCDDGTKAQGNKKLNEKEFTRRKNRLRYTGGYLELREATMEGV